MSYSIPNKEISITNSGQLILKPSVNSTSAILLQDVGGFTFFLADSTDRRVAIGQSITTPTSTLHVFGSMTATGGLVQNDVYDTSSLQAMKINNRTLYASDQTVNLNWNTPGVVTITSQLNSTTETLTGTDTNLTLQLTQGGGATFTTAGGGGSQTGGGLTLSTGAASGSGVNHNSGSILITTGAHASGTGNLTGGSITLTTGNSNIGNVQGGSITLTSGNDNSGTFASGGNLTLTGGQVPGGTGHGGSIFVTTSNNNSNTGGNITITTGPANVTGTNTGGGLTLTTGDTATGAPGTTLGGSILLTTGNPKTGTTSGGNITLSAFDTTKGGNLLLTGTGVGHGQVTIGGSTPDASASLDIQSTTRGALVPRMTTTQKNAIGTPATGLLVYDTTLNNYSYYNGTSWTPVGAVTSVTGTANQITASPTTGAVVLSLPSTVNITTLNLTNPLTVANGGTGTTTPSLVAGTNITSITGSWPNQTINAANQTTSPAGANTQIQYNNSGAFGASSNFIWNQSATQLTITGSPAILTVGVSGAEIQLFGRGDILFGDADTNYVQIKAPVDITSNYVLNLPAAQGTTNSLLTNDGSGNLSWGTTASLASYVEYVVGTPSGSYSGSTTVFALPFTYNTNGASLAVFYNGQQLAYTDDYTETSTTSITTTTALTAGAKVWFRTISGSNIAAPVVLYRENYVVGTPSGTYTGSTTVFNLAHTYNVGGNAVVVTVDGVTQTPGASNDYVETSNNIITFNTALIASQAVSFMWANTNPAAGTVISATANQMAYYASTGTAVSGSNGVTTDGSYITSMALKSNSYTANHTITTSEVVILANANAGGFNITLPDATTVTNKVFYIKKTDTSGNTVTLNTTSSQTIDGSLTVLLSTPYTVRTVISDGSNWQIL